MPSRHSHSSHSSHHSSHHTSRHSHSSHSSRSTSRTSRSHSYNPMLPDRARYNQPNGYPNAAGYLSTTHICRRHTYVYYDHDWEYEGQSYQKGYYDENGEYYPNVAFKNSDNSYNIYLKCAYCGSQYTLKWTEGELPKCESCGAIMDVADVPRDEIYNGPDMVAGLGKNPASIKYVIWLMISIIFFIQLIASVWIRSISSYDKMDSYTNTTVNNTSIWGATVYLKEIEPGRYTICDSDDDWDKYMYWDSSEDSYYDYTTGSYAWYNTKVSPNLWQYWFDDISGDYESAGYGWMEFEGDTWYIETSYNSWDKVPESYDTSDLWHIDNEFDYNN